MILYQTVQPGLISLTDEVPFQAHMDLTYWDSQNFLSLALTARPPSHLKANALLRKTSFGDLTYFPSARLKVLNSG